MKRVIAVGLFVNAVLLAGILLKEDVVVHAAGGGGGGGPAGNGDVNGDGKIDISDAVYLLSSLFTGGPAPKAIECPPPAVKGLPATGQTKCGFDPNLGLIPCDQADCQGQDAQYATGCQFEGRFVDNGDGTVTDNCTSLTWQKDTADLNGDGQRDEGDELPWCDALAYCENLSFAGHDDWRLPNVRELQSIVDYGRFGPSIAPVFSASSAGYWSSTSVTSSPENAWVVYFSDGVVSISTVFEGKAYLYHVRAVRGGL